MTAARQALRSRPAVLRFGALLIVAACGGAAAIDYADVDGAARTAQCTYLVRCGLFLDDAGCRAYFRTPLTADRDAARGAGKLDYDGAAAKECYDALAALSCDTSSREARVLPAACGDVFRGTVPDGAVCAIDVECASGACDPSGTCTEGACCMGTCGLTHLPLPLGSGCAVDADCEDDARCGAAQTCAALGVAGEACLADRDCDYGLGCIGALPPTPGTCRPLGQLGEPCPFMRCATADAVCSAGTCVPVGLPGAACETAADCSAYARCNLTAHACAALPTLGQPCDGACAGDASCDLMITHACAALLAAGTPCSAGSQCASFACMEGPVFDACADAPLCY